MDDLNVLKKYIGEKIKSIEENNKLIEQKQEQVAKLEKIYSPLISGNYANIDKNYLRDCFDFIFEGKDVNLIIERIYQSIAIVSDDRFAKEPQKPVAEGYLNKINTLLLTNIEKLKENIMKIKSEADDKISEYEEYFDLIKDGKIVRHLNENELKRFFKFLNESSLDKNVILSLTVLFSKDSLDYAENLRKLKIVREETVKKDNVAKVKEQIKQQNRNKVEEPKTEVAEVEFALTSKENEIYYKMLEIMNILTNDIELRHDALVDILSDDYSLEARKSIYDSTDDKFNLILEDLKVNLIPNFKDNKDDVISIFKYIIDLFNEEYKKQEEVEFVSQVEDFSEEEKKEIEEEVLGTFTQYPIRLAWAITVHKSQGLTFSRVVIDFTGGVFAGGQAYVALSRCTSLEGIQLKKPINRADIFVRQEIVNFAQRFNNRQAIDKALKQAQADVQYVAAVRAFDRGDMEECLEQFFRAIHSRYDIEKPVPRRFIRRKLEVINTLREQNRQLKEQMRSQQEYLKKYAREYLLMGNECITQAHDARAALANYDKALELYPDYTDAWIRRGITLFNNKEWFDAENCFNTAIRISPANFKAFYNRGKLRLKTEETEGAIADLDKATSLKPEHAKAHELFGDALLKAGKEVEAAIQWRIAEELKKALSERGGTASDGNKDDKK